MSSIRLAPLLTAVRLAREFTRHTLDLWRLAEQRDSAELIVSELVTNAVKSEDAPDGVVGVQLRLVGAGLYVEVWDRGDGSPVIPEQALDAEGGRGLFLVEAVSSRLGVQPAAAGGKIVWAELALPGPVAAGPDGTDDADGAEPVDLALMQRAVDGFRAAAVRREDGRIGV